ncbi:alkyl/aryl-sulfatase [Stackebrandtia nassauensis]|uniref:Beta-lactamase domain protein n=1 Tax=Stackebrandtia nassauensis (strain DSM 44728 / CIP 108903 / NRRL B-16338 / NBRC 102104 / LLR-40K-21) TaxID=446470 RepID=D3Q5J7_STANL|nr:alkyl sulfatase dimerization domain-containing protein [Stackebrandtia nassauensis]ADD46057.1 beta-lactamase domain protein [Stackebrandtia nassauensis DSM 44728]
MNDETPYPCEDKQDFADADRGLIAELDSTVIRNDVGEVVWDNDSYTAFLTAEAADTVHPSLWRQSRLVAKQGLYEVTDGIYQVRGLDLSNISFIEGDTGVLIIDPLLSVETAREAIRLYRAHRGERPVTAVMYTHSHADHFGGVKGVVSQADVDAGVPVIAPEGFLDHAISENVFAGTAMARRAGYMYGAALPRGVKGGVGAGLGQTTSTGTVSLIAPTVDITTTGQELTVDGVRMVFQMAPGTEAPAEMHILFPGRRALCMAENATHTLHNLLTLRGAQVRDPHAWARYLTEAIDIFADQADLVFASHHWPTWGADNVVEFLSLQRDLYAYQHDQTVRLLNKGYTGTEIAELIELPPAIQNAWHTHGYYGSVSHNVKAVYQRYMGWYDGNPARLWQHPPAEVGRRYLDFMGGADTVVAKAKQCADDGDLRWAAQVLDHVLFAEPGHSGARALLADVLERLGFGAENGTWRNVYLSGATELRNGNFGTPTATATGDILAELPPSMFFDALAVQVDGPKAWDLELAIAWTFPDHDLAYRTTLRNGVFSYVRDGDGKTDLTVTVPHAALAALALGDPQAAAAAGMRLDGDRTVLEQLLGVLDPGDPRFNIIEP